MNVNEIFDKYRLREFEIEQAIQDGLISKDIYTILTYIKPDGYYHERKLTSGYFGSIGVKVNYTREKYGGYDIDYESFYLTDFYLIYCARRFDGKYIGRSEEYVHTKSDSIKVIPLDKLEYIRAEFMGNESNYLNPTFKEVKKDPVKGAVIGAVLAGAPGAVVGAELNRGTKLEMLVHSYDNYDLRIKFIDGEEYKFESFYEFDVYRNRENREVFKNMVLSKCEISIELINRSKQNMTLAQKREIVAETISNGASLKTKEKKNDIIWTIVVLGLMFILAWLASLF